MAFSNDPTDRKDDSPFRSLPTSHEDSTFPRYPTSLRDNLNRAQPLPQTGHTSDPRTSLQRRFTTESAKIPTMLPIGHTQRGQVGESVDMSSTTLHKVQMLEKKRLEYEMLKEQRRRFEAEMQLIDLHQRREEQEILQMAEALGHVNMAAGHQSEPTTPPEYRDTGFPSALSRPNRFSASSLMSPSIATRAGRSGSQLTSPPSALIQTLPAASKIPSKSVPGSRRNSDEDEPESAHVEENTPQRSAASLNRNSMPATASGYRLANNASDLDQTNTAQFLFGDDDSEKPLLRKKTADNGKPTGVNSYLQMNANHEDFPILVRHHEYPGVLSASSAALDLALSQSPGPESQSNGWPSFNRHRSQQSLPMNALSLHQETSPKLSGRKVDGSGSETSSSASTMNRRSMESGFSPFADAHNAAHSLAGPSNAMAVTPPKLQSSYSTNDIPTVKNTDGVTNLTGTANTHAQQHFRNHNASLGRIPPNAINNRQSRDMSVGQGGQAVQEPQESSYQPLSSALHASAPPFGPSVSSSTAAMPSVGAVSSNMMQSFAPLGYYGYGMPPMNMGMNSMHMNNQFLPSQPQYPPYQMYGFQGRNQETAGRPVQQKRFADGEANRFANVQLESLRGEIYPLCKDQHGCRYLQKKLEERNPEHIQMIFLETNEHVVELMTDPFGNYLCQKMLEYANDEQRTVLINNAAPYMLKVALNQHGTRALQKMIEFISTPEQIQTIIRALQYKVVELIQDLNGNHVVQKCLNRLTPEDAQFIFDAVGTYCVVVGTHRHGCCVLQRCIDHASGNQKVHLISQISMNAFPLVQDPFGNYVVQYILDLNEPNFTDPLVHRFIGHVPALSKQKFSSNVIEKCIRTSEPAMRHLLIQEMLEHDELEKMLRDSYANYVIQTAIDFADIELRNRLIENIRPILPAIRSTPYGRRIQGKISALDGRSGDSSGQITPNDNPSPGQIPINRTLPPNFNPRQMLSMAPKLPVQTFPFLNGGFGSGNVNGNTEGEQASSALVNASHQTPNYGGPSFPSFQSNLMSGSNSVHQPLPATYSRGAQAQAGSPYYF
ncbi:MAG: hypothetical protein M1817_003640 [Caeruleum heppii]|nr:MAG: hypothetical protein M1817_003640 [Caeruleum heppii]